MDTAFRQHELWADSSPDHQVQANEVLLAVHRCLDPQRLLFSQCHHSVMLLLQLVARLSRAWRSMS